MGIKVLSPRADLSGEQEGDVDVEAEADDAEEEDAEENKEGASAFVPALAQPRRARWTILWVSCGNDAR
jgi:hypothetical protein